MDDDNLQTFQPGFFQLHMLLCVAVAKAKVFY